MKMKPTLRIVEQSKVRKVPGIVKGQVLQPLVGVDDFPSEKVRAAVATFQPGVHELLHWHPITNPRKPYPPSPPRAETQ